MQSIIFTSADLSLIATIIECALIVCLVVIARVIPAPSLLCRHILGLLFGVITLDALSILLIWHEGLRYNLEAYSPLIISLCSVALTAKGPLLYLFIKSISQPNYAIKPLHALHALPLILAAAIAIYYRLDTHLITTPIETAEPNPGTLYLWSLLRTLPVVYAIASLISLKHMQALYDSHYTGNEYHYGRWIKLLVFAFLIHWLLALGIHIVGQFSPSDFANTLGKANDFIGLLLVNGLLIYCLTIIRTLAPILGGDTTIIEPNQTPSVSLSNTNIPTASIKAHAVAKTPSPSTPGNPPHTNNYKPVLITQPTTAEDLAIAKAINKATEDSKPHLDPTLNLEKFSYTTQYPSKDISRIINIYYQKNFSEFINAYRTLEAERLLSHEEHEDTPILDIIYLAGFNSKSAFHRFFKRFTGITPSQYRNRLAHQKILQSRTTTP